MTILCCEYVLKNYPEKFTYFIFIQNTKTSDFKEDHPQGNPKYHLLSNGWWVNTNKSSESHINFCICLLEYVGIDKSEWSYRN